MDDETKLTLHGLQQYYVKLKDNEKNRKLFDLLDVLEFNQVRGGVLGPFWGGRGSILGKKTPHFGANRPSFSRAALCLCLGAPCVFWGGLSVLGGSPGVAGGSSPCFFPILTQFWPPQVVIFVKSVQRCIALAQLLVEQNFPAIAIHRGMPQEER